MVAEEKHDIFIISGHAKPDCILAVWDLKEHKFIKQFKGHVNDVTSISTLQDGHTIISGSKDGVVMVNDFCQKKPIKIYGIIEKSWHAKYNAPIAAIKNNKTIVNCFLINKPSSFLLEK